jgi:hypothetical protein
LVVVGIVAVVGALVVSKPTPGGDADGFGPSRKVKPFVAEQATAAEPTPVVRSDSRPALAGLPTAQRAALPPTVLSERTDAEPSSGSSTTAARGATSTSAAGPAAGPDVVATSNSVEPVPAPAPTAGGELAPAGAISLVLSASPGSTTAHAAWTVTGGQPAIAGFELSWSCCGARQGSVQLPAGVTAHDVANLVPGTAYVLQLAAILHDGSIDAASVTTTPFTTATVPAPPTVSTAPPRPAPEPAPVPVTKTPITEPPAVAPTTTSPSPPVRPRTDPRGLSGLLPRLIDRVLLGGAQADDDGQTATSTTLTTPTSAETR